MFCFIAFFFIILFNKPQVPLYHFVPSGRLVHFTLFFLRDVKCKMLLYYVILYYVILYCVKYCYIYIKDSISKRKKMSLLFISLPWLSNGILWSINKLKQGLWCTIWLSYINIHNSTMKHLRFSYILIIIYIYIHFDNYIYII